MTSLRDLPSVDSLLKHADDLLVRFGRPSTLDALRLTLDETRARLKRDGQTASPSLDSILASAESRLAA